MQRRPRLASSPDLQHPPIQSCSHIASRDVPVHLPACFTFTPGCENPCACPPVAAACLALLAVAPSTVSACLPACPPACLPTCPPAPPQSLDFYGALRASTYDNQIRDWIKREITGEDFTADNANLTALNKRLVQKLDLPKFEPVRLTLDMLVQEGERLEHEQEMVRRTNLAQVRDGGEAGEEQAAAGGALSEERREGAIYCSAGQSDYGDGHTTVCSAASSKQR